ncbi:MAG: GFA family protein [Paracoccaceae bacterium]
MPSVVSLCHCADCRRQTGAPVAAFACFAEGDVVVDPSQEPAAAVTPGVTRGFCRNCGSPLTAQFDYLPGQIYIPLGILDQADVLAPALHSHEDARLPWLHISDDLPRYHGTSRDALNSERLCG